MAEGMKIAIIDVLSDEFEKRWREDLGDLPVDLRLVKDLSEDALNKAITGANVVITRNRSVDRALLKTAGDDLRMVIKLSHWRIGIDEAACAERNVIIENVPQLGCITVAEHAMALLLMCARDMIRSHLGVVSGGYREYGLTPAITSERSFAFKWLSVKPFEVYEKTLGIVGFGEIGKELATRANAFGMRILYHDVHRAPAEIEQDLNAEYRELDDLVAEADFISLHIPHVPVTEQLIGVKQFKHMKRTAYLINACRGGVVDERALVKALKTGEIAGAGLDVFVEEPLAFDHPLTKLNNVVLSPHIGGGSGNGRVDQRLQLRALINKVIRTSGKG